MTIDTGYAIMIVIIAILTLLPLITAIEHYIEKRRIKPEVNIKEAQMEHMNAIKENTEAIKEFSVSIKSIEAKLAEHDKYLMQDKLRLDNHEIRLHKIDGESGFKSKEG